MSFVDEVPGASGGMFGGTLYTADHMSVPGGAAGGGQTHSSMPRGVFCPRRRAPREPKRFVASLRSAAEWLGFGIQPGAAAVAPPAVAVAAWAAALAAGAGAAAAAAAAAGASISPIGFSWFA